MPMAEENDPHLVSIVRTLGEVYGPENVSRVAAVLADPEPVRALADAAADVLQRLERGQDAQPAADRLYALLYGEERS